MKPMQWLAALLALLLVPVAWAAPHGKVLVLLSSQSALPLKDGKSYASGYYLNEFGTPADALLKAGYQLVLVTPQGNKPSVDTHSIDPQYFGGSAAEMQRIQGVVNTLVARHPPLSLAQVLAGPLDQYSAIFIPGGHAPLIDLDNNPQVGQLLRYFHAHARPTAAICHGPAALLSAQAEPQAFEQALLAGRQPTAKDWIYRGYHMTLFSDPEEQFFEHTLNGEHLRFYAEDAMRAAGGNLQTAPMWQPHVVVDRELITAQNPFSDHQLASTLIQHLQTSAGTP